MVSKTEFEEYIAQIWHETVTVKTFQNISLNWRPVFKESSYTQCKPETKAHDTDSCQLYTPINALRSNVSLSIELEAHKRDTIQDTDTISSSLEEPDILCGYEELRRENDSVLNSIVSDVYTKNQRLAELQLHIELCWDDLFNVPSLYFRLYRETSDGIKMCDTNDVVYFLQRNKQKWYPSNCTSLISLQSTVPCESNESMDDLDQDTHRQTLYDNHTTPDISYRTIDTLKYRKPECNNENNVTQNSTISMAMENQNHNYNKEIDVIQTTRIATLSDKSGKHTMNITSGSSSCGAVATSCLPDQSDSTDKNSQRVQDTNINNSQFDVCKIRWDECSIVEHPQTGEPWWHFHNCSTAEQLQRISNVAKQTFNDISFNNRLILKPSIHMTRDTDRCTYDSMTVSDTQNIMDPTLLGTLERSAAQTENSNPIRHISSQPTKIDSRSFQKDTDHTVAPINRPSNTTNCSSIDHDTRTKIQQIFIFHGWACELLSRLGLLVEPILYDDIISMLMRP